MTVKSVRLDQFRNYDSLALTFDPGTNLFYGENAQGKTNALEAIYLCGTTRSHRAGRDREMIRFGHEEAHIRMELEKHGISYRIDMHLKKNRSKGIAVNGVPVKRASDLIGIGNFIFFSPEDLNIIKNGPAERRRFLDMELCQLSAVYLSDLASYNRALAQRNQLLKDIPAGKEDMPLLDVWDEQLVHYGLRIMKARREFSAELGEIIRSIHRKLSGDREDLLLTYERQTEPDRFMEQLFMNRDRDLRTGTTNCGPHRDDICFSVKGADIRRFGSQGQQRTTALSLKLSEIELVRRQINDTPILLLDDVLSELDENRQKYLLENIHDIQTMISCTGVENFIRNNFHINRYFYVKDGTVCEGGYE
mgnify:CR=1 FL=1